MPKATPAADPDVSVSDYHQHAVIAEVRPAPGHQQRAWERFTPDGPLALLPLGDDYSVVFTVPPEKADAMLALDDAMFLSALQQQFGTRRLDFVPPARAPATRSPCACAGNSRHHARCGSATARRRCTRFPGRGSTSACAMPGNSPKNCSDEQQRRSRPGVRPRALRPWPPSRSERQRRLHGRHRPHIFE